MEETIKQVRRVGLIVTGTALLAFGTLMLVLPGPGALFIVAGLTLLAKEFAWAQQALGAVQALVTRALRLWPRWRGAPWARL